MIVIKTTWDIINFNIINVYVIIGIRFRIKSKANSSIAILNNVGIQIDLELLIRSIARQANALH